MMQPISAFDPAGLATAAGLFFGFIAVLYVGSRLPPGTHEQGVPLAGGVRITYKLVGFRLFLWVVSAAAIVLMLRPAALAAVHAHFWPLLVVANVSAFACSIYLAARGRAREKARPGAIGF